MTTATLMTVRLGDRTDPALPALLSDGVLPDPFDWDRAEVVAIAEEEGVPVGLCSGWIDPEEGWGLLEQIGLRPGFRGQHRTRALVEAFIAECQARGARAIITRLPLRDPARLGHLAAVAVRLGATPYHVDHAEGLWWWYRAL